VRRLAIVAVAGLAAAVLPSSALAHATLSRTTPAVQSRGDVAPHAVVLSFDQQVGIIPHTLEVFAVDGLRVSGSPSFGADHRVVQVKVAGLVRGGYTVRWRVLSSDGHVGSGVFTFGYRTVAPQPTEAYGASGPTWADDVARWGLFVSLAVLLGSLGVRLIVLRGACTSSAAWVRSPRSTSVSRRSCCARRTRSSFPSSSSCMATFRRSRTRRGLASPSSR